MRLRGLTVPCSLMDKRVLVSFLTYFVLFWDLLSLSSGRMLSLFVGKTYTLVGNASAGSVLSAENKDRGIIPRAAETIFTKQANLDPQKVMCQVRLSILEVYQEQLKDLLHIPTPSAGNLANKDTSGLRIREQIDGTVWVENLTELVITEGEEFNRLLNAALKRRVVGAHNMNDVSSRSHFCCILKIQQLFHATGVKIKSKVHFIDLAGSEMVSPLFAPAVEVAVVFSFTTTLVSFVWLLCRFGKQMPPGCGSPRPSISTSLSARWATSFTPCPVQTSRLPTITSIPRLEASQGLPCLGRSS
jgi:hypothetical protein